MTEQDALNKLFADLASGPTQTQAQREREWAFYGEGLAQIRNQLDIAEFSDRCIARIFQPLVDYLVDVKDHPHIKGDREKAKAVFASILIRADWHNWPENPTLLLHGKLRDLFSRGEMVDLARKREKLHKPAVDLREAGEKIVPFKLGTKTNLSPAHLELIQDIKFPGL